MSSIVYDTFSNGGFTQLLTAHTSDTGATWSLNTGYNAIATSPTITTLSRLIADTVVSGSALAQASASPATAEYDVAFDITPTTFTTFYAGVAGRIQADGHAYIALVDRTFGLSIYKYGPNFGQTQLGNVAFTPVNLTTYRFKLQIRNTGTTNQTQLTFLVSTDGGITYTTKVGPLTDTDANYTPAGLSGLFLNNVLSSGYVDNFQSIDVGATDLQGSIASNAISVSTVITLAGTGTSWSAGTPGTPTFTVSGTNGATITGQSVSSAGLATVNVTTGASPGTLIITDPSTGNTKQFTIILPPITIPVTDAHLAWSPYNWQLNLAGSGYAQSQNQGPTLKFLLTGSSTALLDVDVSSMVNASLPAVNYPTLGWTINNGPVQTILLTSTTTAVALGLALTPAAQTLVQFWVLNNEIASIGPRWISPVAYVRITGITVDGSGTTVALGSSFLQSKILLSFGDSITEAQVTEIGSRTDYAYPHTIGYALGCEVGIVSFGGSGWMTTSFDVPPVFTVGNDTNSTWNKYEAGLSRLVAGKLSPIPDYVTINHGVNGSVVTQPTVAGFLTALRAAVNTTTPIFVVAPFDVATSAVQSAAVLAAAVTAQGDPYVYFIPFPDTVFNSGLMRGGPSQEASDGLHPRTQWQGRLGGMVAAEIRRLTAIGSSGGNRQPLY